MKNVCVELAGHAFEARGTGALWWPAERLLVVGDLHLGAAERRARLGTGLLPPYEVADTLERLTAEVMALDPTAVLCLGDSFDDCRAADALATDIHDRIAALGTARDWIWVAGNHDPRPSRAALPGRWVADFRSGPIVFRHIARDASPESGTAEISAHFHPKATVMRAGRRISRRCFLKDSRRLVLPAFGTYTGGLDVGDPAFDRLVSASAIALLTGSSVTPIRRDRLREMERT